MLFRHRHQVTILDVTYPVIDGTVTDTAVIVSDISSRLLAMPACLSQVPPKLPRHPLSPRAQQPSHRQMSSVSADESLRGNVFDAYCVGNVTNYAKA